MKQEMHNDAMARDAHEQFETDPKLDTLLDDALAPKSLPGGVPGDLADRIVSATADRVMGRHHGVLARIGPARIRAVAAAVIFAASVGIIVTLASIAHDVSNMHSLNQRIAQLPQAPLAADDLDVEIAMLSAEIEQYSNELWTADTSTHDNNLIDDEMNELDELFDDFDSSELSLF